MVQKSHSQCKTISMSLTTPVLCDISAVSTYHTEPLGLMDICHSSLMPIKTNDQEWTSDDLLGNPDFQYHYRVVKQFNLCTINFHSQAILIYEFMFNVTVQKI